MIIKHTFLMCIKSTFPYEFDITAYDAIAVRNLWTPSAAVFDACKNLKGKLLNLCSWLIYENVTYKLKRKFNKFKIIKHFEVSDRILIVPFFSGKKDLKKSEMNPSSRVAHMIESLLERRGWVALLERHFDAFLARQPKVSEQSASQSCNILVRLD